jgi:hypothetical protein
MLTAFGIERLKPKGKPYKVSDGNALYLLVKPTGAKLWRVRYHFGGKEQMLSLGAFPAVTLAAARGKRDEALILQPTPVHNQPVSHCKVLPRFRKGALQGPSGFDSGSRPLSRARGKYQVLPERVES